MGIMDREKNRDNALNQIKNMITSDPQIVGQTEPIDKEFPKYAPEKKDKIIIVPEKEETKSKRVNLMIKPSLHETAKRKCDEIGISLNECMNQLLGAWVESDK